MSSEGKKLSGIKKAMAKQMIRSWTDVPQFQLSTTICCDELIQYRKELTTKVSYTAIIAKAVAMTLQAYPAVNQQYDGELVKELDEVSIGIASDTKRGLLVPVISKVPEKKLATIQSDLEKIKEQSKTGKFSMEELAGGTFTISNLGMFNVEQFSSIVNAPQIGILAIGKITKTAIVNDEDQIVAASVMKPVLTLDHRVADGALGARFMTYLCDLLEHPMEKMPKE
ncbi:2-oxo acid dehydrogenase subunit E2 [Enterococcus gilvus]|uniref:2-oxo acid dehydrogenase subunit E2 n=1 Tax=Enterococcus gilvus TaxID=160453 RepID=UPI001C8BBB30|nr:2-oxo acid dehydrogenase subunit E2 [Enterococcus gilvus]MBX8935677.1 2-oxo acid dehydrogenase subunit E2 [Enterococcus gilvus]